MLGALDHLRGHVAQGAHAGAGGALLAAAREAAGVGDVLLQPSRPKVEGLGKSEVAHLGMPRHVEHDVLGLLQVVSSKQ